MYTGYKELMLSNEQMANFYTNPERLTQDLIENEYLLIEDLNGMPVDKYCSQNGELRKVNFPTVRALRLGNIPFHFKHA